MSQYYIRYLCGHEDKVQICGPMKTRETKIASLRRRLCYDCYQKQLKSERQEKEVQQKKENEEIGFIKLNGTKKQVIWANDIRLETYKNIVKDNPNRIDVFSYLVDAINEFREAKWWLDNRATRIGRKGASYNILTNAWDNKIAITKKQQEENIITKLNKYVVDKQDDTPIDIKILKSDEYLIKKNINDIQDDYCLDRRYVCLKNQVARREIWTIGDINNQQRIQVAITFVLKQYGNLFCIDVEHTALTSVMGLIFNVYCDGDVMLIGNAPIETFNAVALLIEPFVKKIFCLYEDGNLVEFSSKTGFAFERRSK